MDDYLSKPIRPEKLREFLGSWLGAGPGGPVVQQPLASTRVGLIDRSTITQLRQELGNDELLATSIRELATLAEAQIALMGEQLEQDQFAAISSAAHLVKGVAGTLGASVLHARATMIEIAAQQQNQGLVRQQVAALEALVAPTIKALEQELHS
jgi:HPt (histidine-containing phosphotransfer) domain-containing protein